MVNTERCRCSGVKVTLIFKVRKASKIRNRYNQVPHIDMSHKHSVTLRLPGFIYSEDVSKCIPLRDLDSVT